MADSYLVSEAEGGEAALALRGDVSSKDQKSLRGRQFSCLFVRHGDHTDIDYLASTFDSIRILDVGSENFDWASISRMPNLQKLLIGAYWTIPWQLIKSEKLESLAFTWDKGYSVSELNFPSLKHLKISGWSDDGVEALAPLNSITYLDMVDSHNLQSLTSLDSLTALSTLRLRGAPKLRALDGVQAVNRLVTLHIEGLKKIDNYDVLSTLESLRGLAMHGCAPINSLTELAKLSELEFVVLGDTKVEDGDLKALRAYPALKKVMFKNKRGYNWTFAQAKSHFEQMSDEEREFSPELEEALKMRL
jgi:hypothetical protein